MAHWLRIDDSNTPARPLAVNLAQATYIGVDMHHKGIIQIGLPNGGASNIDVAKSPLAHAAILAYLAQNGIPFPTK